MMSTIKGNAGCGLARHRHSPNGTRKWAECRLDIDALTLLVHRRRIANV
jgi:hypothetical protein